MLTTDNQKAYALIKEKIITTQLRPGAAIQESALMAELGFGRTPVREALKQLEAEKLVVITPRRGIFVTEVTISDLGRIQEARRPLNLLCARLAVERATPADLAGLKSLVQACQTALAQGDQTTLMALDRRFYQRLAQCTHNEFLAAELERLYNLSMRIWYLSMDRLKSNDMGFEALAEIVQAIETQATPQAERALLQHIQHFGDSVKQLL